MFYNTINLDGIRLTDANYKAKKQEELILDFFKKYQKEKFTPFEVSRYFELDGIAYPITSFRRAITNLTSDSKLIKLPEMKDEIYGKPNYCWRLA